MKTCLKFVLLILSSTLIFGYFYANQPFSEQSESELLPQDFVGVSNCKKKIHFILVTKQEFLTSSQKCAITSAKLHNPSHCIYLWAKNHVCNLNHTTAEQILIDERKLFRGLPLRDEKWQKKSRYFLYFLSDAVRLAILYRFGGIYMDLDMITLRPIESSFNYGFESDSNLNGAFLQFDRGHPFLLLAMKNFVEEFQNEWGHQGPDLMKRVHENYKEQDGHGVSVAATHIFYPVPWTRALDAFKNASTFSEYDLSESYTLHTWSALTKTVTPVLLLETLEEFPPTDENGCLLFKWLFTDHPKLRDYFVGDENIAPSDVMNSPRFKKAGKRYIRKIQVLIEVSENKKEFRKHVADLMDRHKKNYRLTSVMDRFQTFADSFVSFLHARLSLEPEEVAEWNSFWKYFIKEVHRLETGPKTKTLSDWHAPQF